MTDDSLLAIDLPAVARKKVSAAFDAGQISSDGGLVLLCEAERRLRRAETLAGCIRDRRNQPQIIHPLTAAWQGTRKPLIFPNMDKVAVRAIQSDWVEISLVRNFP